MIQHVNNGQKWLLVHTIGKGTRFNLETIFGKPHITFFNKDWIPTCSEELPFDCERYGIASQLTEEQAKRIVVDEYGEYPDFMHSEDMIYASPSDSLHSLCRSHGMEPENALILKMKN